MKVGSLYRMTEATKAAYIERTKLISKSPALLVRKDDRGGNISYEKYDHEALIVPLEAHESTIAGTPLKGKDSRRLKVLMTDGVIGELYVFVDEWEEAT